MRDRNRPLVAGVVFNVEPLLELPDKKIHMRLEDTVLITPTGADKHDSRRTGRPRRDLRADSAEGAQHQLNQRIQTAK